MRLTRNAGIVGLALVAGAWWLASPDAGPGAASPALSGPAASAAAQVAAAIGPGSLDAILGARLEATTPAEVRAVVRFCRGARPRHAAELVRAARTSPDPLVAANALEALGRLGLADVAFLDPCLTDERMRVRQAAITALAGVRGADRTVAAEHLARIAATDADPTARALAIRSLGCAGGPDAREKLALLEKREALTDVDRAFLRTACREAAARGRRPVSGAPR